MEKQFIEQAVFASVQEVLSTMLGMEAEITDRLPIEESTEGHERVVALVGLAGDYMGTGTIGCSPKFACKAASNMTMTDYPAVDGEVLDAIGEIANMIFGNVKTALEGEMGELGLSIPTVVFGHNFCTRSMGSQSWIDVPVKVEEEEIDVRLCITTNPAASRQSRHSSKREQTASDVASARRWREAGPFDSHGLHKLFI